MIDTKMAGFVLVVAAGALAAAGCNKAASAPSQPVAGRSAAPVATATKTSAAPARQPVARTSVRRVQVPISQVKLPDGTIRYSVPVRIGGSRPIQAMLDSGSYGLRVLSRALPARRYHVLPGKHQYQYGSGVMLVGPLARTRVSVGGARTEQPVLIQVVKTVRCRPHRPHCAAAKLGQQKYRIGGDGLPGQGFEAIIGVSMRAPAVQAAINPLASVGDRAWIIELPLPGSHAPGALIVNPNAHDRAGFQTMPVPHRKNKHGKLQVHMDLPVCLDNATAKLGSCPPVNIDTGSPKSLKPFYEFDVLFDLKHALLGEKPRPKSG